VLQELEYTFVTLMDPLVKLACANIPEVIDELVRRGVRRPSLKDLLDILELRPELLTDERLAQAIKNAPDVVKGVVRAFVVWAGKNDGFSMDYPNLLKMSKELDLQYTLKFLLAYPNIARRLIDFFRRMIEEYRRLRKSEA
jgi:hypothetical protein